MTQPPRPYNILFVTPAFVFGGLERVILDMVRELDRSRFTPMLCSLYPPVPGMARRIGRAKISFFAFDKGEGVNWRLPFRLARLFRKWHVDLVNAHDIGATFYAAIAARLAGIRRVVHSDHSQILGICRRLGLYGALLRYGTTRATTVSDHLRRFLIETLHYPADRVQTLPNGVDLSAYLVPSRDLRADFGFGSKDRIIGAVGRLTEQKGMIHLVRALPLLLESHADCRLVIVGEGPLKSELEAEAARLGVADRVLCTGVREDIRELMGMFDLFALPSLWEGQPLVLIEAMAAGVPIVAADVGGVAEVLGRGQYGVLVPPANPVALADALRRLLEDASDRRQMAERAKNHALANLTHTEMTRRYETLFSSLLNPEP